MRRLRISTSAKCASTAGAGTGRRSRSRRAVWVSWKRVSFCQRVSSPSSPTYLIPNTLPKKKTTSSRTGTRRQYSTGDAELDHRLTALVEELKLAPVDARSTYELLVTAIRRVEEIMSRLDRKLINASFKKKRYAFNVFSKYRDRKKVSVFGSARTPGDDPNYRLAREFGRRMAAIGWMVVTGAGPGIMSAANEGAGQESSFGVNIGLPFEAKPNPFIASDPKLINFKYFFTRKLMFMKEAEAFVLFPGGFGTMDELFELLTLSQTGKSDLHPIVMVEAEGGGYWRQIDAMLREDLPTRHYIDSQHLVLHHPTESIDDPVAYPHPSYPAYPPHPYAHAHL